MSNIMLLYTASPISCTVCQESTLDHKINNYVITVKPLNKGHVGDGPFVPCREVVLFSEVLF